MGQRDPTLNSITLLMPTVYPSTVTDNWKYPVLEANSLFSALYLERKFKKLKIGHRIVVEHIHLAQPSYEAYYS